MALPNREGTERQRPLGQVGHLQRGRIRPDLEREQEQHCRHHQGAQGRPVDWTGNQVIQNTNAMRIRICVYAYLRKRNASILNLMFQLLRACYRISCLFQIHRPGFHAVQRQHQPVLRHQV